jgi:hypothetical protein
MPKALEQKLIKQATAQGLEGEHKDAYVYGTLRKTGWVPEREKKKKSQTEAMVQQLRARK